MIEIPVGVSNRHVHLTNEDVIVLFGNNYKLTKKRDLKQKGEFACEEVVTLKTDKGEIENVRVLGPIRNYTQVEILKSDTEILKINPPVRTSGELIGSETITIVGPNGSLKKENSCIIATRHIHINSKDYEELLNDSIVSVKTKDNIIIDNVHIKKGDNFELELHIDKDDAQKYNLKNGDVVSME